MSDGKQRKPAWLVPAACCVLVAAMVGLSYASVPLYDWFCRVTGYGGTIRVATGETEAPGISDRVILIRFDANVSDGVDLRFRPQQVSMPLQVGEQALARYITENPGGEPFHGMATFNVTPHRAGPYVSKTECFCFSQHMLEAGESVAMPVSFFIDPSIEENAEMDDIHTITLSYTFFETAPRPNETENDS